MNERPRSFHPWADLALLGIGINLVALLVSPLIRPDLNPWRDSLSYYAVGPSSWLQSVAFVAMGAATIALGLGLKRSPVQPRWRSLSSAMLVVSGVCSVGLFVFPMGAPGPRTFIGDLHQTAGTIGGVAQLIAALAFAVAVRHSRHWSSLLTPAVVALLLAATGALLTQIAIWHPDRGIPMGATMRLVVIPLILFWGAVAIKLREHAPMPLSRSGGAK